MSRRVASPRAPKMRSWSRATCIHTTIWLYLSTVKSVLPPARSRVATPRVVDQDAPAAVGRAPEDVGAASAHLDTRAVGLRPLEPPAVRDERDVACGHDLGDLARQARLEL